MNKSKIKTLATLALLMALIVIMQSLSSIIPPIGGFTISLVLIPIVIGAVVLGPKSGAFLGGVFGIIVYINCVTGADPGGAMVFQASPVLCFLVVMSKGIFAGLLTGVVYKTLKSKNEFLATVLAAAVCPIVNTGIFVICMLVFFIDVLAAWAGGATILGYILTGLILANFVPEFIINVVFASAGTPVLKALRNKR